MSKKNKERNAVKSVVIPEVELAQNICYAILHEASGNYNVVDEDTEDVLDMAMSLTRIALRKAREAYKNPEVRKSVNKGSKTKDDKVKEAAEFVDKMFAATAVTEKYLAESENREVNIKYLGKMAKRIVRAAFKDIEGVDAEHLDIVFSKDNSSISITIPKQDEN